MRRLIVTSLLTGLFVFGFSTDASAAGYCNGSGMNGASLQGNGYNGGYLQGSGFQGTSLNGPSVQGNAYNGGSFQGNGYNGGYLQGSSYNAGGLQGNSLNGPAFQGNGLNASAVPNDAPARHVSPTSDTSDDVRIQVSVPRHGLRLNGVILADPAATTE